MALKGDRAVYVTDISHISEDDMEAGSLLVVKSSQPSGRGVGQGINDEAPVAVALTGAPPSGTSVAGVLLDGVVDIDPVRQHRNFQKTEQLVGEPVCLLKDGWVWTDKITGTPAAGDTAYLATGSTFGTSQTNAVPAVGKFITAKNADGFAKVSVKIA
jgi:hypothetical protein